MRDPETLPQSQICDGGKQVLEVEEEAGGNVVQVQSEFGASYQDWDLGMRNV